MTTRHRFERKIRKEENGCWIWTGGKKDNKRDYGVLQIGKKSHRTHRVSMYIYKNFDLNSIDQINHKCNNTLCVNPDHLYIGTQSQNMKDWHAKLGHFTRDVISNK